LQEAIQIRKVENPDIITSHTENRIAIISASNPPVNALSHGVRQALAQALNQAQIDDDVKATVICCAGAGFFSGADIRDFDKSPREPMLTDLVEQVEAITKPVIASLHGNILGGELKFTIPPTNANIKPAPNATLQKAGCSSLRGTSPPAHWQTQSRAFRLQPPVSRTTGSYLLARS
jgi:1,4-dihydroxy-2-naphthoyl-CoA synthase